MTSSGRNPPAILPDFLWELEKTTKEKNRTKSDVSQKAPRRCIEDQDRGFRVFKLADSNFKPWDADMPHEVSALERQLDMHVDHIREGRTADDILYEILLEEWLPLNHAGGNNYHSWP